MSVETVRERSAQNDKSHEKNYAADIQGYRIAIQEKCKTNPKDVDEKLVLKLVDTQNWLIEELKTKENFSKAIEIYYDIINDCTEVLNNRKHLHKGKHQYFCLKRGQAYSGLGNQPAAIQDITDSINLNPNSSEAYRSRANAYEMIGEYKEALADLDSFFYREEEKRNNARPAIRIEFSVGAYISQAFMREKLEEFQDADKAFVLIQHENLEKFEAKKVEYQKRLKVLKIAGGTEAENLQLEEQKARLKEKINYIAQSIQAIRYIQKTILKIRAKNKNECKFAVVSVSEFNRTFLAYKNSRHTSNYINKIKQYSLIQLKEISYRAASLMIRHVQVLSQQNMAEHVKAHAIKMDKKNQPAILLIPNIGKTEINSYVHAILSELEKFLNGERRDINTSEEGISIESFLKNFEKVINKIRDRNLKLYKDLLVVSDVNMSRSSQRSSHSPLSDSDLPGAVNRGDAVGEIVGRREDRGPSLVGRRIGQGSNVSFLPPLPRPPSSPVTTSPLPQQQVLPLQPITRRAPRRAGCCTVS